MFINKYVFQLLILWKGERSCILLWPMTWTYGLWLFSWRKKKCQNRISCYIRIESYDLCKKKWYFNKSFLKNCLQEGLSLQPVIFEFLVVNKKVLKVLLIFMTVAVILCILGKVVFDNIMLIFLLFNVKYFD